MKAVYRRTAGGFLLVLKGPYGDTAIGIVPDEATARDWVRESNEALARRRR